MYRLFQQRSLRWQLLLILVEFALLVGCVYTAVALRFWGDSATQIEFGRSAHWNALLVAGVLVLAMGALGLCQVHLRVTWLRRPSRQGVAFPGFVDAGLFYVKNHNFVFDLAILVQTVEVVLFGRGARWTREDVCM
ncbi:MAG TPA: hypothetical protein VJ823_08570 [Rhodanobacteraceae bacterium]|nr:hypothetical protein [Rhodanobacteraceae bacterium]